MKNIRELEKNVSHETILKLKDYEKLLNKWQKAINLVSNNTLNAAWERHFMDSLQLEQYLPNDKTLSIIDLGSGGGFPPLVLAIDGYNNISAIESDERKCFFMQEVAKQTDTKINIINERIEKVEKTDFLRHSEYNKESHINNKEILKQVQDDENKGADVITSRALAKISELLIFSKHLSKKETIYLFLKGKTAEEEIKEAQKSFDFEAQLFQSLTSDEANIVKITNLIEKNGK